MPVTSLIKLFNIKRSATSEKVHCGREKGICFATVEHLALGFHIPVDIRGPHAASGRVSGNEALGSRVGTAWADQQCHLRQINNGAEVSNWESMQA